MTVAPSAELELMQRVARRDAAAFEQLVARHQGPLYRFALRMCLDPARAEDTVQEALLSAWREAGAFLGHSTLRTWLFSILLNACRHSKRTRVGQPDHTEPLETAEDEPSAAPTPEVSVATLEQHRALDAALGELEPSERQVVLLRDVEGLSGEDVAGLLGLTLPAMKSRLHRARAELKTRLEARLRPVRKELRP
ncbi:MAG: RNA polymerase sigma factor [Myxococcaceae bacterium]